jgi:hypothetical protein
MKLVDNNKVATRRVQAEHALCSQRRLVHKLMPSEQTPATCARQFCKKTNAPIFQGPGSPSFMVRGSEYHYFVKKIISRWMHLRFHPNRMTLAEGSRLEISTRAVCFTDVVLCCRVLIHPRGFGRKIQTHIPTLLFYYPSRVN